MSTIETPRLILRPWTEDDAFDLLPVFSNPEAMKHWNTPPWQGVDEVRSNIRRSLSTSADSHAAWSVVSKETDKPVGFVNYHHREPRNHRLEIGYIIGSWLWRTGLMSEAVRGLIAHCFQNLNTYRIEATVSPDNAASLAFLERLDFTLEGGPMRARMWTSDGRKLDALMLAILEPDWRRKSLV